MIIEKNNIYHIDASLKDLGKKRFAFSKLEEASFGLMMQIGEEISSNQSIFVCSQLMP